MAGSVVRRIPAAPPPHLLRRVDEAAARAAALWSADRELHFEVDSCGAVVVQLRDRAGGVIGTLEPSTVLEVMTGGPL